MYNNILVAIENSDADKAVPEHVGQLARMRPGLRRDSRPAQQDVARLHILSVLDRQLNQRRSLSRGYLSQDQTGGGEKGSYYCSFLILTAAVVDDAHRGLTCQ